MNWIKEGKEITSVTQMPKEVFGFIYLITDENGRKYLGKKQVIGKRKRHFGKKESAAITDKRKRKWEYVFKETNWKKYTGSNDELNEAIKNGLKYKKEILYYANSKKDLTYFELRELWSNRVLETPEYYNSNISGKHFNRY